MIKAHNERYEKGEETGRMVFTTYSDLVSMRHLCHTKLYTYCSAQVAAHYYAKHGIVVITK